MDVADKNSVISFFSELEAAGEKIDICVNNAMYAIVKYSMNTHDPEIIQLNIHSVDFSSYTNSFVGCVILTADNKILLQYRPDNWDTYPGYLTTFGGKIENKETAIHAVVRELQEELGAEVKAKDIVPMGIVTERITQYTELVYHYFWHDDNNSITGCYEGEPKYYKNIQDILQEQKVMADLKFLLHKLQKKSILK